MSKTLIYALVILGVIMLLFRLSPLVGAIAATVLIIFVAYICRAQLYTFKARKAYADGKFAESKRQYQKAIKTGKATPEMKIEFADTLMRTGHFEDAEQILNNILREKIKPETEKVAKLRRCMVYYKTDNFNEAYADAMELYNEGMKNTYLYGLLGYFKMQISKDGDETLNFCKEAYEYNSDDRDIMDNLAICYYNRGEYEKAKEFSDKIMEENPQFVEAYYHGALIENALGNYEKSMEYIEKIPNCRWSEMTTVSKEEVEALKKETESKLGEK